MSRIGGGEAISNATPGLSCLSFVIAGGSATPASNLRLDRINSQVVMQLARRAMFQYMERCPSGPEPCGVVLQGERGRVVFELPVLLPEEQYVPIDLLRGRSPRGSGSRVRWARPG